MYLYLALFWLVVGVLAQVYWETLRDHAFVPVDRAVLGFIFFVLFSYNLIRWRLARMMRRTQEDADEMPPRPRVYQSEYDPTFDFSEPDADDKKPDDKPPGVG